MGGKHYRLRLMVVGRQGPHALPLPSVITQANT